MTSALTPPTPGGISIGNLNQANKRKRHYGAVLTLEDPSTRMGHRLRFTAKPCPAHLVLHFEDVDTAKHGIRIATHAQVEQALEFGRAASSTSLLVHCMHGIGRSTAIALAILADRLGKGREDDAIAELYAMRPEAAPNLIVIALADEILERDGALSGALARHEATDPKYTERRAARLSFLLANMDLYSRND